MCNVRIRSSGKGGGRRRERRRRRKKERRRRRKERRRWWWWRRPLVGAQELKTAATAAFECGMLPNQMLCLGK